MADIDMVPVGYHRRRRYREWLMRCLAVYAAAAILVFGVAALLERRAERYEREIANLEIERERAEEEQRELTRLGREQETLSQRIAVLQSLRGGIEAKHMFKVVDDALDEHVWFRNWNFRRAGEIVDEQAKAIETGYFIVLPQEAPDEEPRTWRFHTHMEFSAEARDHAALAGFVRRLTQKPEIENARILNTRARQQTADESVEFEVATIVRSTP